MENEFNGIEVFEVFTVLGIRLIRSPNTLLKWIWYVHTDLSDGNNVAGEIEFNCTLFVFYWVMQQGAEFNWKT